jgi:hypothetical protein
MAASFRILSPSFTFVNDRLQDRLGVVRVLWHLPPGGPCALCRRHGVGRNRATTVSLRRHLGALRQVVTTADASWLKTVVEPVGYGSLESELLWPFVRHANTQFEEPLVARVSGSPGDITPARVEALVAAGITSVSLILPTTNPKPGAREAAKHLRRALLAAGRLRAAGLEAVLTYPLANSNGGLLVPAIDSLADTSTRQLHIAEAAGAPAWNDGSDGARAILHVALRSMERFRYWKERDVSFRWSASHPAYLRVCRHLGLADPCIFQDGREPAALVLHRCCDGSMRLDGRRRNAPGTDRAQNLERMLKRAADLLSNPPD